MRKFWIVFKYEFGNQIKNKTFLVISGLLLIAAIAGGFFLTGPFSKSDDDYVDDIDYTGEIVYVYSDDKYLDYLKPLQESGMFEFELYTDKATLEADVIEYGTVGLIVYDYNDYEMIVSGTSIFTDNSYLEYALNNLYETKVLADSGLNSEEIANIQNSHINVEINNVGVDGVIGYGYTYVYSMLLYMAVLMFGSVVSSSVIVEKTSKAMELLITSAKPTALVAGKVIAVGISCLIQIAAVLTSFIASFTLFSRNKPIIDIFKLIGGIPWDVMLLAIFLFIVGFFSVLFLFAGFSSFASKPEDANTVVSPLIIIILVVFMINMSSATSNMLTTTLFKVLSYIPILSPFLLFSRYTLYGLSTLELSIGVISNLLGAFLLILFASKIYRSGTLYYGNKISVIKIFKSLRNK